LKILIFFHNLKVRKSFEANLVLSSNVSNKAKYSKEILNSDNEDSIKKEAFKTSLSISILSIISNSSTPSNLYKN
jgi:hypothetical protein